MSAASNTGLEQKAGKIARLSSLFYILLHLLDIYSTYLLSPDLSREANIMIARFGFGWGYIFLSAALTSLIMLLAQSWAWKHLVERSPTDKPGYMDFYHQILFNESKTPNITSKNNCKGIALGLTLVILYSMIAAKFFAVAWNTLLLTTSIEVSSFPLLILLKNLIAGLFGLYMFFIFLYSLHRAEM